MRDGLQADGLLEAEARAALAAVHPVGEQVGRHAHVADQAAVGAAVGQPEDGVRVGHHLAERLVVVVDVAGQRREQERLAVALEQPVEGDLLRRAPLALGHAGDARRRAAARSRAGRRAGRSGPTAA